MGFVYLPLGFPCQLTVFRMKNLIDETLGLMRFGRCIRACGSMLGEIPLARHLA